MSDPGVAPTGSAARALGVWLLTVAGMVLVMAVIGAITRLTESGLSMVEWRPFIGVLPPLSEAEWQRVFGLYQNTPEFRQHNFWMTLPDFKTIFWWEWFHRLWAHAIAGAYALPLLFFALSRRIPKGDAPRLLLFLALGGLQGVIGGIMVASGLVDAPQVNPYKLALHLSMAVLLFGLLLWQGFYYLTPRQEGVLRDGFSRGLKGHGRACVAMVAVTIFWGALVAGHDAGLIYNSWPLMGGQVLPAEAFHLDPAWRNATENPVLVQFLHRWLGALTALMVLSFAVMVGRRAQDIETQRVSGALAALSLVQPLLGITTLLLAVPLWAGALHQAVALLLLGMLLRTLYLLREPVR